MAWKKKRDTNENADKKRRLEQSEKRNPIVHWFRQLCACVQCTRCTVMAAFDVYFHFSYFRQNDKHDAVFSTKKCAAPREFRFICIFHSVCRALAIALREIRSPLNYMCWKRRLQPIEAEQ